jgi:hypothetical protein
VEATQLSIRGAKLALESYLQLTSSLRMKPDFVIIGAQRSGTTSLYRYLAQHPQMAPTLVSKGVHYFDTEFGRGAGWYRGHFPLEAYRRLRGNLRTGEASPYYLYHPLAPRRIAHELPDVRLVAMLRDPVSRAYSHFQHERQGGFERLPTFEEAIDAEPSRLAGEEERMRADPGYNSFEHQHHSYLARGRYIEQLRRWWELFDKDRILIVRSEDFFANLDGELERVQRFLGLEPRPATRTPAYNAHTYEPMARQTRERLDAYFEPFNKELARELGRKLNWAGTAEPRARLARADDGR